MKVEMAVLGSPSLVNLMVSLDVKQHWNKLQRAFVKQSVSRTVSERDGVDVTKVSCPAEFACHHCTHHHDNRQ